MSNIVEIAVEYAAYCTTPVGLPTGKTWEDVTSYYVKWDVLYVEFKDGSNFEQVLDSDFDTGLQTKRPITTEVFAYDKTGNDPDPERLA